MEEKNKKKVGKEINLEDLKKKLDECKKQKNEYLAGWQRSRADFLNYKKDEAEKIGEILKYANEEFILKILPILDNFEKAEEEVRSILDPKETPRRVEYEKTKIEDLIKGFLQIRNQLKDFLKNQGVEEIKTLEEKFDPNFHEAIEEVKIKDKEPGIVIEEVQKGYLKQGRLLRPAKVKVTK